MANRFRGQHYAGGRADRAEELDQRFGMLVLKMRRGVEAFQANDTAAANQIRKELDQQIKALDEKVQRELAGYVRTLVLDELTPVATLHYAGPIGRSYLELTKLALQAKQMGFSVDPFKYRDSIVAIAEGKENERIVTALVEAGRFEKAREIKTGAFAARIREAAPRSWFEPKAGAEQAANQPHTAPEPQTDEMAEMAEPAPAAYTGLSREEMDRIAESQLTHEPRQ